MGFNIDDLLNFNPQQGQDNLPPVPMRMPDAPAPMDPTVQAYLTKKMAAPSAIPAPAAQPVDAGAPAVPSETSIYDKFKANFSDDNYKKAMQDAEDQKSGLGWSQFAAGIGDAMAGRNPSQTAQNFDNIRKGIDNRTVGAFEKQKAAAVQDIGTQKALEGSDPNSAKSKVVQQTIQKTWPGKFTPEQIAKITADDADLVYKPLELQAKLDEQHDNNVMRREMMQQSQHDRQDKKSDGEMMKIQQMAESARISPAVAQAEKDLYATKKVDSMVNLYGDPNKLNPQQVQLLASEVAKIASGGVPTTHELQGLNPSTIPSGLAQISQKLTNSPSSANAGAFVKAMQDYTNSLKKDAQDTITDKYGRVFSPYGAKYKDNPQFQALQTTYMDRFKNQGQHSGSKPQTVTQNGHTYTLNPQTGEYE